MIVDEREDERVGVEVVVAQIEGVEEMTLFAAVERLTLERRRAANNDILSRLSREE